MRKVLALVILGIALLIVPVTSADDSWSMDLVAGQHTTIGTVEFLISGDTLYVKYEITTPGWCLGTTHLYVDNVQPTRIAPGRFQYKHENNDCVTIDEYAVPVPEGDVFVAAHADTSYSPDNIDLSDLYADTGSMTVTTGSDSYFNATVDVDGLETNYPAWCVDLEHFITTGVEYDVSVSEDGVSLDTGDSLVDVSENLDLILYVINQDYAGATANDIQTAIWLLIDDKEPLIVTSLAEEIVADAYANGEGFSPGCGDVTGVFMDADPSVQNIMVVVPAPCIEVGRPRTETAWALTSWGHEFGQGWGMYMQLAFASDDTTDNTTDTSGDTSSDDTSSSSGTTASNNNSSNNNSSNNNSSSNTSASSSNSSSENTCGDGSDRNQGRGQECNNGRGRGN